MRPFVAADTDAVANFWVRAWDRTMPQFDFSERRPWLLNHLQTAQDGGAATVVAGEGPSGFLILWPATGELDQLAVAPEAWGTGVAEALMRWATDACEAMWLDVNQDNPRAVAFYRRHGFAIEAASVNPGGLLPIWRMRRRGETLGAAPGLRST